MTRIVFDIVVIGAGMAGAVTAAFLAPFRRVALLEAEDSAGYHTTGRSAALWTANYGPPDVRLLTAQSRAFYETPPAGFSEAPLMRRRPVLFLATPDQAASLDRVLAEGAGLRRVTVAEAERLVPAIRPGRLGGAAVEDDAFDMDVSAIHQGFLRSHRRADGVLALRHRAGKIWFGDGAWHVETAAGTVFEAGIVVNAAGAWCDEVAAAAGIPPLGLVPKRRTAAIVDPAPHDVENWPVVLDVDESWYARTEARTRLMVSPADETSTHPHDVQPEEIDVATGIDRMQRMLAIEVRRVERAWAGLRTFTPDGSLAIGWERAHRGFFWCAGQGGYGIQTAPAAGQLAADLILGHNPRAALPAVTMIDPARFR